MTGMKERKRIVDLMMNEESKYFDNGKYAEALVLSDMITKIDPNDTRGWHNKGAALFAQQKYGDALFEFDMALRVEKRADTLYMKSLCLQELQKLNETFMCLSEAIGVESKEKEPDKILLSTMNELIERIHKQIMTKLTLREMRSKDNFVKSTLYKRKEPDFDKVTFLSEDGETWATIEKKSKKKDSKNE